MLQPFLPPEEEKRLHTLRDLLILDTEPEQRFDVLTEYVSELYDVPIALVSLVDAERQWFKSRYGLDATETPRDISFCGHAILNSEPLVVNDTLTDPRFADNPLVIGEPHIRFYAGVPLHMKNGMRVGTLCIIDRKPRQLSELELGHLQDLAKVVANELQGIDATKEFLSSAACKKFCTVGQVEKDCPYQSADDGFQRFTTEFD
jgi:GAF domain-containing protein